MSKWVHCVCGSSALDEALDEEEEKLLQDITTMLRQEEAEVADESNCLAARLLRYWAGFYDDTWVWGGKSFAMLMILISPGLPFRSPLWALDNLPELSMLHLFFNESNARPKLTTKLQSRHE